MQWNNSCFIHLKSNAFLPKKESTAICDFLTKSSNTINYVFQHNIIIFPIFKGGILIHLSVEKNCNSNLQLTLDLGKRISSMRNDEFDLRALFSWVEWLVPMATEMASKAARWRSRHALDRPPQPLVGFGGVGEVDRELMVVYF